MRLKRHKSDLGTLRDRIDNSKGSGPRGVVIRTKVPPIEEHEGMLYVEEAMTLQEDEKYKSAIKKYKVGIAMLEATLPEIDRHSTKREWVQKIDEIRHKMNRCKMEIENRKREKLKQDREAERIRKAEVKIAQEKAKLDKAKAKALSEALGGSAEMFEDKIDEWRQKVDETNDNKDDDAAATALQNEKDKELKSVLTHDPKLKRKHGRNHTTAGVLSGRDKKTSTGNVRNKKKKGKNKDKDSKDENGDEKDDMEDEKLTKHERELRDRIMGDLMIGKPDVELCVYLCIRICICLLCL